LEAAGAGEDHIVLVQLLDHRGPRDLHHDRHDRKSERQRRQREMPEAIEETAAGAIGGEPAEYDAEKVEEEDAGDERRRGDAEDAERDQAGVGPGAGGKPRQHAEQYAEAEHDDGAHGPDEEGEADALEDGGGDELAALDRLAEIALEHLPQPLGI